MKKFLLVLFSAVFSASAFADAVFTWALVSVVEPGDGVTQGYKFYVMPTPIGSGPFTPVASVAGPPFDATTYITQDVEHEAWVTAFNPNGESPDSNHVRFTDPGQPDLLVLPAPPTTLSLTGTVLTWSASAGDGYRIYVEATPIGTWPFTPVADVATTTYDLAPHVADATETEVWVTTYNPVGESFESMHIRFTLGGEIQTIILPHAPTGFEIDW